MEDINVARWKELLSSNENAVVIDVRTPSECDEGTQENAIQINFLAHDNFKDAILKLSKSNTYFVYCRSGNRSRQACLAMEKLGLETYNLEGGMLEWEN